MRYRLSCHDSILSVASTNTWTVQKYDIYRLKNERLTATQDLLLFVWLLTLFSHVHTIYTIYQHVCIMFIWKQQAATASLSVKPCYYVLLACTTPFFLYIHNLARLLTKRAQTVKQQWLTWFRHKKIIVSNYSIYLRHIHLTSL